MSYIFGFTFGPTFNHMKRIHSQKEKRRVLEIFQDAFPNSPITCKEPENSI